MSLIREEIKIVESRVTARLPHVNRVAGNQLVDLLK